MKKYEVAVAFWYKNNLVPVGAELTLSDKEAKYTKHALREKIDAPVIVAVDPAKGEDYSVEAVVAVETGEVRSLEVLDDKPRKRRK